MDILSREATLISPSEKGSTLKGKNSLPWKKKFFPIRVHSFWVGTWFAEKQRGNHKFVSLNKLAGKLPDVSIQIKSWQFGLQANSLQNYLL